MPSMYRADLQDAGRDSRWFDAAARHAISKVARRRCLGPGPMVSFQGGEPLLTVRDLAVDLRHRHGVVHAVRGLSYSLDKGEAMGMVGESGSGKTISSLALLGLLPAGITAWFAGAYRCSALRDTRTQLGCCALYYPLTVCVVGSSRQSRARHPICRSISPVARSATGAPGRSKSARRSIRPSSPWRLGTRLRVV